jgi:hypothetical protein
MRSLVIFPQALSLQLADPTYAHAGEGGVFVDEMSVGSSIGRTKMSLGGIVLVDYMERGLRRVGLGW